MKIEILPASIRLKPVIQNMARFYIYDLSKSCGHDTVHDGLSQKMAFMKRRILVSTGNLIIIL